MFNIKTDSRKVKAGDIFVALKTPLSSGEKYIEDAIKAGATTIVAQSGSYSVNTIIVDDTREYLENYLKLNYNKYIEKMKIVGITGTNGKTTIAYLINQALNLNNIKSAYLGTVGFYMNDYIEETNNSTPDICDLYEYLMKAYENNIEYFIMEVSSHALALRRVETITFDTCIFTNLTQDHLDFHGTMENYMKAKQKLFFKLKENGLAIVNKDDKYSKNFILSFNNNILYSIKDIKEYKIEKDSMTFELNINNKYYNFKTNLIGKFNLYNLNAVIKFLSYINVDINRIINTIENLIPPKGRVDIINFNTNKIIIDYAHTPDAIEKIIDVANDLKYKNLYIVFGCTGCRDKSKRPIMGRIVSENATRFIITNDDVYTENPIDIVKDIEKGIKYNNYSVILNRYEAIKEGISYLKRNDILMILGKGHENVMKLNNKRIHFNDKECVLEIIKK